MQVLEAEHDTGSVENGPRLREHVRVDVHHQVPSGSVFHDEAHVTLTNNFIKDFNDARDNLTLVWKQENKLTKKGCRIEFATSNILFSASKDSTSSRAIISPFLRALIAKYSPVFLYLARMTLPK